MKSQLTAFLFLVTAIGTNAQSNSLKKVLLEKKTFPLSSISNLELSTSGGSISVQGSASGEATLEVYVATGNGKSITLEEAKNRIAENYDYETGLKGNTLFAKAEHKKKLWTNKNSVSISYKVVVPVKVSSKINTSGGSIQVANVQGTEAISTSGGSLDLDKIIGKLDANTSGGSISLTNSSGGLEINTSGGSLHLINLDGKVEGNTSGGSIQAESISGDLDLATSGGSISLKDIAATTDAATSGGSINASFKDPGKGIHLSTSGGGINIKVPKNKGYDLDLKGDRANISNASVEGKLSKSSIKGKTNGGGIPLEAKTSAGSVNVDFY